MDAKRPRNTQHNVFHSANSSDCRNSKHGRPVFTATWYYHHGQGDILWKVCKRNVPFKWDLSEQEARAIAAHLERESEIASVRVGVCLTFALRKQADFVLASEQVWTPERQHQFPNE